MIDAYEIGIQLLLQDDVSAGLAVINRGLAEVDQAIVATSARLATLVQETGSASKALASVASVKPAATSTLQPVAEPGQVDTVRESRGTPDRDAPPQVIAPIGVLQNSVVAPATADAVSQPFTEAEPRPRAEASVQSAVAPSQRAVGSEVRAETMNVPPRESIATPAPRDRPAAPPQSVDPVAKVTTPNVDASASPGPAPKIVRESPSVVLTASLDPPRQAAHPVARRDKPHHVNQAEHPARMDRVIAPWTGVAPPVGVTEGTRLQERAASPAAQGRERADAAIGTVMLDGRLVGQWLAEHMAREASRPPGGTSFFDPRQAPAWNVSGAL